MKKPGKKISLFNFLVILLISAGIIVFFVNNIISVNKLVVTNEKLKEELNKNISVNNNLKTEAEKLSSYDNIKETAVNKLNLKLSTVHPKKIVINKSDLDQIEKN